MSKHLKGGHRTVADSSPFLCNILHRRKAIPRCQPSPSQTSMIRSGMSQRCRNCRRIAPLLTVEPSFQKTPSLAWQVDGSLRGIPCQNHMMRQPWLEEDFNKPIPGEKIWFFGGNSPPRLLAGTSSTKPFAHPQ
ncbi:unnamed protein product [Ectocarpus sp. 12 AP-2014]